MEKTLRGVSGLLFGLNYAGVAFGAFTFMKESEEKPLGKDLKEEQSKDPWTSRRKVHYGLSSGMLEMKRQKLNWTYYA